MYPKYPYPRNTIAGLVHDAILLRHRVFREDAVACIRGLKPPLHVLGQENIPQRGPCVVMVNHYCREGFAAQWIALAIAATFPVDMHWVMTGELTYPGRWYAPLGMVLSKFALHRIARVYGFTPMPPMPPRQKDLEERAASVRKVLEVVRHAKNPILGLAPEGGDSADGKLARPASGVGRFGLLLSNAGLKFIPVGVYEEGGVFVIHFGESYVLKIKSGLSSEDKDLQAAQVIMMNIAKLLPENLRGEFA
jgi:hypothetical protein